MTKENPDILDFLKVNRRIIRLDQHSELIYKICAKTGLSFENAQEISCLIFEEMINGLAEHRTIKFIFGTLRCGKEKIKFKFKNSSKLKELKYE